MVSSTADGEMLKGEKTRGSTTVEPLFWSSPFTAAGKEYDCRNVAELVSLLDSGRKKELVGPVEFMRMEGALEGWERW